MTALSDMPSLAIEYNSQPNSERKTPASYNSLPREVRLMLYELIFDTDKCYTRLVGRHTGPLLALTSTSRLVRQDAAWFFYYHNKFKLDIRDCDYFPRSIIRSFQVFGIFLKYIEHLEIKWEHVIEGITSENWIGARPAIFNYQLSLLPKERFSDIDEYSLSDNSGVVGRVGTDRTDWKNPDKVLKSFQRVSWFSAGTHNPEAFGTLLVSLGKYCNTERFGFYYKFSLDFPQQDHFAAAEAETDFPYVPSIHRVPLYPDESDEKAEEKIMVFKDEWAKVHEILRKEREKMLKEREKMLKEIEEDEEDEDDEDDEDDDEEQRKDMEE
ncbi:hypothetical protein F4818DRAFT_203546 [Hypoxylon cercidicola]|nr:hypothetical protein F4818DRAFT_203546 [Hypoxylon cercidicola]